MSISKTDLRDLDILNFFDNNTFLIFQKKIGNNFYYAKPGQKTGSVAVDAEKKYFYDHQDGVGGGIIKAYELFYNQTFIDYSIKSDFKPESLNLETKIISVGPVKHYLLKKFFTEKRKIDVQFLSLVNQIDYTFGEKKYFTIGWSNVNGGYNTQNLYLKRILGDNGVTYLRNNKSVLKLNVFEAYFDYLAYLTFTQDTSSDALILNSTSNSNFDIDISFYDSIDLYLDNDTAGNTSTNFLLNKYPKALDKRFYSCKDYNDFILL